MATAIFNSGTITPRRGIGFQPASAQQAVVNHRLALWARTWLLILVVFLLPSSASAEIQSSSHHARTVFRCDFQAAEDRNSDRQPDGWRRIRDRQHPAYIGAAIVPRDAQVSKQGRDLQILMLKAYRAWKYGRWEPNYVPETIPPFLNAILDTVAFRNCYEVRMDSGAFELVSPQFELDPQLSYRLQADAFCDELTGHDAVVELHVLNRKGEMVQLLSTNPVSGSIAWSPIESATKELPKDQGLLFGEIHLRVQPKSKGSGPGIVRFDNLRVIHVPSITLETDAPMSVTPTGQTVQVRFHAIGLAPEIDSLQFSLVDVDNKILLSENVPIHRVEAEDRSVNQGRYVSVGRSRGSTRSERKGGQIDRLEAYPREESLIWMTARADWKLTVDRPGFHRLRVNLGDGQHGEVPLAVVGHSLRSSRLSLGSSLMQDRLEAHPTFGWAFDRLEDLLNNESIIDQIRQSGVGWVKLPIWIDHRDAELRNALLQFISQLKDCEISCVGVIDRSPQSQQELFEEDAGKLHPVSLLRDRRIWSDSVEPILSFLNPKLDWLQIGGTRDRSLATSEILREQWTAIRKQIQVDGNEFKIAIGWDRHDPRSSLAEPKLDASKLSEALHFTIDQEWAPDELSSLAVAVANRRWQTWTSIQPLPASEHGLLERVIDLLQKLITVREAGVQAAFMDPILDDQMGLFSQEGQAGELLIPWNQIVSAIATKTSIGSLPLASHSTNRAFTSDTGTVLLIWNDKPVTENVYFGDEIVVQDIWGRTIPIEKTSSASGSIAYAIPVGKWPLIVSGVDRDILRWQQEFALLVDQISSHLVENGTLPIHLQNTLNQKASGRLTVHSPSLIGGQPIVRPLELAPDATIDYELPFTFRPDTSAGLHRLEFAFDIEAPQPTRFSIHRDIKVGHPDIELKWSLTRLSDALAELSVEVENNTPSPVSFDCRLFPRDRAYQRLQIADAACGVSSRSYQLAMPRETTTDSQSLWIRCEQVGTGLVLNYQLNE